MYGPVRRCHRRGKYAGRARRLTRPAICTRTQKSAANDERLSGETYEPHLHLWDSFTPEYSRFFSLRSSIARGCTYAHHGRIYEHACRDWRGRMCVAIGSFTLFYSVEALYTADRGISRNYSSNSACNFLYIFGRASAHLLDLRYVCIRRYYIFR